jgi:NAD(P)-dependent dehydrogenase (short-subunit alcohol dehydrogenase family)
MRFQGKTAILTGAAGSIGRVTAARLAQEGANLILLDRDAEGLKRVIATLDSAHCLPLVADVTDPETMPKAVALAKAEFGGVDIFFANSGVEGVWADIETYSHDVYDKVMDVNVKSVFLGLQSVLPQMRDGGSIIITSSVMGLIGSVGNIAYSASKHAVVGLRRSAAIAAGARGIRVNTVHPGFVDSEMLSRLMSERGDPEVSRQRYIGKAKLGRLVQPLDIANMVLFLASDESSAITNQALVVDAGVLD